MKRGAKMFVFQIVFKPDTKAFKDDPSKWFDFQMGEIAKLKSNLNSIKGNTEVEKNRGEALYRINSLASNIAAQYPDARKRPAQITGALESLESARNDVMEERSAVSWKKTFSGEQYKWKDGLTAKDYDRAIFKLENVVESKLKATLQEYKKTLAPEKKDAFVSAPVQQKDAKQEGAKQEAEKVSQKSAERAAREQKLNDALKYSNAYLLGKQRLEISGGWATLLGGDKPLSVKEGKVGSLSDGNLAAFSNVLEKGTDCWDSITKQLDNAVKDKDTVYGKGEFTVKMRQIEDIKWATLFKGTEKIGAFSDAPSVFVEDGKKKDYSEASLIYQMYLTMGGKGAAEKKADSKAGTITQKADETAAKKEKEFKESKVKLVPLNSISWLPDFAGKMASGSGTIYEVEDLGSARAWNPSRQNALANGVFARMQKMGLMSKEEADSVYKGAWNDASKLTDTQKQQIATFKLMFTYEGTRGLDYMDKLSEGLKGKELSDIVGLMQKGQNLKQKEMAAEQQKNGMVSLMGLKGDISTRFWGGISIDVSKGVPITAKKTEEIAVDDVPAKPLETIPLKEQVKKTETEKPVEKTQKEKPVEKTQVEKSEVQEETKQPETNVAVGQEERQKLEERFLKADSQSVIYVLGSYHEQAIDSKTVKIPDNNGFGDPNNALSLPVDFKPMLSDMEANYNAIIKPNKEAVAAYDEMLKATKNNWDKNLKDNQMAENIDLTALARLETALAKFEPFSKTAAPTATTKNGTPVKMLDQQETAIQTAGEIRIPETGLASFDKFRDSPEVLAEYLKIPETERDAVIQYMKDHQATFERMPAENAGQAASNIAVAYENLKE